MRVIQVLTATGRIPRWELDLELADVGTELRVELRPFERQLDRRLQPAHRRAAVVARAFELVAVDRLLLHEGLDRVRQLDLAAGAARGRLELVEDLRRQDVAPDDGEVRWSVCRRGRLDEPGDLVQPAMVQTALDRLAGDYPVALRVRVGD